jgi:hypothetical protein
VLPGFVARNVAPTSRHWPERMATSTLGTDGMWNGAGRLGAAALPVNWYTMVEGAIIVQDNRDAVDGCRRAMGKNAIHEMHYYPVAVGYTGCNRQAGQLAREKSQ